MSGARARRRRRSVGACAPTPPARGTTPRSGASMTFSASPRRPTSVRSSACSTLRERSPAAIADAVPPISSSGRRPSRTSQRPSAMIAPSTTAVTTSSIRSSRSSVELDVRERGGEDEHRTVVLRDRRAHPVLTAAVLARDREVADRLAIRGLPRRRRHRVGHRRRRHALAGDRRAGKGGDHRRPVERTHLHERPGRRKPDPAAGAGAAQGMGRLVERAVGAVEQERAQRRVRRDVGDEEPDSRERDDRQQEPRTQRQALAHGYDASSM